jgi:hypothetical protein
MGDCNCVMARLVLAIHDFASLQQRRLDARPKLGHEEAGPGPVIWIKEPAPCASAVQTLSSFESGADARRSLSNALVQSRTRATLMKASSAGEYCLPATAKSCTSRRTGSPSIPTVASDGSLGACSGAKMAPKPANAIC